MHSPSSMAYRLLSHRFGLTKKIRQDLISYQVRQHIKYHKLHPKLIRSAVRSTVNLLDFFANESNYDGDLT